MGVVCCLRLGRGAGSCRMKVLAVFLLAAATLGWEMEEKMVKMWTKMKAHEACWGEENTKQYTVKMKKAIAKCTQQDAPELQLPIYRNPYRVVNGLLNGAQQHERYVVSLLETIANNMNNQNNYNQNNYNDGNFQPGRRHGGFKQGFNQQGFNQGFNTRQGSMNYMNNEMVPLSQEYVQKLATEVMRQMKTTQQQQYGNVRNNGMGIDGLLFNNRQGGNTDYSMRFKRQAEGGVTNVLDLGDRLRDKIVEAEKHAEQKIGNMTCVMKEMHIINDNHEIDIAAMKAELRQMVDLSEWFKNRVEKDMDNCYAVAQNIPVDVQTAYAYPGNPHLAKLKAFMTCCKTAKTQSCVYQDVRDKLEKNFGPLQKLLDTTGLTEQQLFPLVLQLLHGSEMEFMETL